MIRRIISLFVTTVLLLSLLSSYSVSYAVDSDGNSDSADQAISNANTALENNGEISDNHKDEILGSAIDSDSTTDADTDPRYLVGTSSITVFPQ